MELEFQCLTISSAFNIPVLKTFCSFCTTGTTSLTTRSVSTRPRCNISSFYLSVNGEAFPSQPIENVGRMYSELLRSFDSLTDTNAGGVLTLTNFGYNIHTTADDVLGSNVSLSASNTNMKRFIGAVDLDRFNHSSELFMAGTNTQGQQVNLILNMSTATTDNLTLVGVVQHDIVYSLDISNGQMNYIS